MGAGVLEVVAEQLASQQPLIAGGLLIIAYELRRARATLVEISKKLGGSAAGDDETAEDARPRTRKARKPLFARAQTKH